MNKKIYFKNSILEFGRYKGLNLSTAFLANPSYIIWCFDNIDNFCIDENTFELLISEYAIKFNSHRSQYNQISRQKFSDYFSKVRQKNSQSVSNIYSLELVEESEKLLEQNSKWRNKWDNLFYDAIINPVYLNTAKNIYEEWLLSFSRLNREQKPWLDNIHMIWLEEIKSKIYFLPDSVHVADFKIGLTFIFLVERKISKIEILKRESYFKKIAWIINLNALCIFDNSGHSIYRIDTTFLDESNSNLESSWECCFTYPYWADAIINFKYSPSEIFFEIDDKLYRRKFYNINNNFYKSYLKLVSFEELFEIFTQKLY